MTQQKKYNVPTIITGLLLIGTALFSYMRDSNNLLPAVIFGCMGIGFIIMNYKNKKSQSEDTPAFNKIRRIVAGIFIGVALILMFFWIFQT